jgi:hypothetical protein
VLAVSLLAVALAALLNAATMLINTTGMYLMFGVALIGAGAIGFASGVVYAARKGLGVSHAASLDTTSLVPSSPATLSAAQTTALPTGLAMSKPTPSRSARRKSNALIGSEWGW